MSRKSSVYISDRSEQVLGDSASLSGRINAVIDRYGEIIRRAQRVALREFSADELAIIKTVCTGMATGQMSAAELIGSISAEVEDGSLPGGDIEGQSVSALLDKLTALSPAEELALIEWLEG